MKAKESYEIRLQMAKMHDEFIQHMSDAYDRHRYIETCWYCYAIIEQRINRLISKYIDKCMLAKERVDNKSVAISTRIICIKKLITVKYYGFDMFEVDLMDRITAWCDKRNDLVHGLVSLDHYREFDNEFEDLAVKGVPLVFELYEACSDYRDQWYQATEPDSKFPIKNCKCKKKKCINPLHI